jgi:hypothetical protein
MSGPIVALDFAAPRLRSSLAGIVVLSCGLIAMTAAWCEYHFLDERRAGLELKLAGTLQQARPDPARDARTARTVDEAAGIATDLGTPWTHMLADLELASRDLQGRIAVLAIEPDREKHRVRISGESKDLSEALRYLSRLQAGHTLKFPMLDSHEVVADGKDHPVRFTLSADWWAAP